MFYINNTYFLIYFLIFYILLSMSQTKNLITYVCGMKFEISFCQQYVFKCSILLYRSLSAFRTCD